MLKTQFNYQTFLTKGGKKKSFQLWLLENKHKQKQKERKKERNSDLNSLICSHISAAWSLCKDKIYMYYIRFTCYLYPCVIVCLSADIYVQNRIQIYTHAGKQAHKHDFLPQASGSKSILWWGIALFLIKRTGGHEIALSFFTTAALHESKLMIKTLSCSKPSLTQDW